MKTIKNCLLIAMCFTSAIVKAQQAPQLSQYMFHGLFINPAYAGYRERLNITGVYRSQWTGVDGSPKTSSIAADNAYDDNRVGLGLNIISDKLGWESNFSAYANYAYRIHFDDDYDEGRVLALGLGIGVVQHSIDGTKRNIDPLDNAIDPVWQNIKKTKISPDMRIGAFYNTDRFYAGISADNLITHLFQKKDNSYPMLPKRKMNLYLNAGCLFPVSENLVVRPSLLYKDAFSGPSSLDLNAFVLMGQRLWVGGSYRTALSLFKNNNATYPGASAVIFSAQVYVTEQLRVGYSYDRSLGNSAALSPSSHEISIGFLFKGKDEQVLTPRYF
jgi:type IX secretion system PorP/SprF family membrane protein